MELMQYVEVTTRKIRVRVADGIRIQSGVDKAMEVSELELVYTAKDDQWIATRVVIYGMRLRKDGSVGVTEDWREFGSHVGEFPWLEVAVEHYRPKGEAPESAIPSCILNIRDDVREAL